MISGRATAVAALGLTLAFGGVAQAQGTEAHHDRTVPVPSAGTSRVIRLGPQAMVREDDRGNIQMVDEEQPKLTEARAAGAALGSVAGGVAGVILLEPRAIAAGSIYGAGEPLEDVRPSPPALVPRPTQSPP
jgi:hypothetical protein